MGMIFRRQTIPHVHLMTREGTRKKREKICSDIELVCNLPSSEANLYSKRMGHPPRQARLIHENAFH